MVLYYCQYCPKIYDNKGHYDRHIKTHGEHIINNTSTNIKLITSIIQTTQDANKFICQYCQKTFISEKNMNTHINQKCKSSPHAKVRDVQLESAIRIAKLEAKHSAFEAKMEARQLELEAKLMQQNEKIDNVTEVVNTISQLPIININVQVNNPKFIINDFGSEKPAVEILSHEQMNNVVTVGGDAVSKLVEYKHFNKDLPENHNIMITKIKADTIPINKAIKKLFFNLFSILLIFGYLFCLIL